ncbi:MAG: MBL fold metallo-hydrolase, partial [Chitinophagaceae bacterium]
MFAVTILGNNSAIPTLDRNPTAQVITFNDQLFLVDCGEGSQVQLSRYKIKKSRIQHILISHLHGDHYFGLIGLINSFNLLGRSEELKVYAPPELKAILEMQLSCASTILGFTLTLIPLLPDQTGVLIREKDLEISYFKTHHRIPCYGFLFREKKEKKKIKADEVRKFGIPTYFYPRLQEGEDYTGKDGELIKNDWV